MQPDDQPTVRDVLALAAAVDLLAADAAIERAFSARPVTPRDEMNEATIRRICRLGDPVKARAALILDDLTTLEAHRAGAGD
ncbi:hypothetical protein PV439_11755 [Streptomyces scabiei]|uniref:hypothetical protein n=1 Tax=Streptomyces scabiei TaxID=1930 RepID=UPI00298F473C|nr:hypothetical protein [Streptomyces scabiei]MDW8804616.1 hypothetical protein [Streptomyces scabiei]MDX2652304.1 hypothetical protein [Streptomyces scabiei]MDX2869071.1 hypothetical protein [Streptomyces scabiei]MDX2889665.1 hypothetical protein [Streptomyces scabiei]MDX2892017.1 hypothetical protein [Streptomyces scabiei]